MSRIFKNRYQAQKARKTEPFFSGAEICVKVCGGYVLMDPEQYRRILKEKDTVKVSSQRIARALIDRVEGSVMENHTREDGYYRVYTEKGFCRIIAEA